MEKRRVLSILVKNERGVLPRICGLFARRGYNIESLAAASTEDEKITRMTVVATVNEDTLEQIEKQVSKLYDVYEVKVLNSENSVSREHVMVVAGNSEATRGSLIEVANLFHANILNVTEDNLMLELTGKPTKIDAFIELIKPFGIIKLVRSGLTALEKR